MEDPSWNYEVTPVSLKIVVEPDDKTTGLRTKKDILDKICGDLSKVKTSKELIDEVILARIRMKELNLFTKVKTVIDTSEESPIGYEVTFKVTEAKHLNHVGMIIDSNSGGPDIKLGYPNAFGRGERIGANLYYGTKQTAGLLYFSKPVNSSPTTLWETGLYKSSNDFMWSSYRETATGASTALNFETRLGQHSVRYEGTWREVKSLAKTTDMSVREEAGHSVKSSLKHTWTKDTRDHTVFPSEGYLMGSTFEVAGLGGDAKFLKKDSQLQLNKTFFEHYVMQLSLAGGWSKSLKQDGHMHLSDRFYLGGPLTMRGFSVNGCGPRNGECAVGGNTYCLAGAHLYSPLPFRAGKGGFSDRFRLHAWGNAGNVLNIDYSRLELAQLGHDLKDNMRLSCGIGIAAKLLDIARIELNYCFPFRAHPNDSSNPGWQFGIGLTFL